MFCCGDALFLTSFVLFYYRIIVPVCPTLVKRIMTKMAWGMSVTMMMTTMESLMIG